MIFAVFLICYKDSLTSDLNKVNIFVFNSRYYSIYLLYLNDNNVCF